MSEEPIEAVVRGLGRVAELPVGAQVAVFEQACAALEEALAAMDDA
ncbi:hypothetical protein [Thermoactinospora rubra]|nr:hypothetical protein [Thermoactinospora rubra]